MPNNHFCPSIVHLPHVFVAYNHSYGSKEYIIEGERTPYLGPELTFENSDSWSYLRRLGIDTSKSLSG